MLTWRFSRLELYLSKIGTQNTKFRVPQSKMHQFYTFSSKWGNMVGHDSCIWLSGLWKLVKILMIPLEVPTLCNRKCQKQLGISKWRNCNPYQWKREGVHFSLAEVKGWNVLQEKEGGREINTSSREMMGRARGSLNGALSFIRNTFTLVVSTSWMFKPYALILHECRVDTLVWPRKFH